MDRYIARANIAHFADLLRYEVDAERRRVIEDLLAQERQKLEIAEAKARKQTHVANPAEGSELPVRMDEQRRRRPA
ncbi:MAG: hypothetical protein EOS32_00840 [Mesorhizobium sp.]|uniref:hypothetical protein n=1 Tax=Mesorhizobium sp. TaxID=1871066 RepID=UPI000FE584D8|nr:hypothetical protein [Mesorhizobium sp.]RWC98253.1 MAG: hypothetical protein EOS32_00840 [Mesorhizobium sp.]